MKGDTFVETVNLDELGSTTGHEFRTATLDSDKGPPRP